MKKYEDNTGLFLLEREAKITSIEPREGKEGTIVKIKGSGFSKFIRNNCIVVGGMGACARAQEGTTDTELIVRIDPVAKVSAGDVLMWPGAGSNFFNEKIGYGRTKINFTETAIFRNGAPVAQAGIEFKLTQASKNTFGGSLVRKSPRNCNLSGRENEYALRVQLPKEFESNSFKSVDICLVLKEHPTIAIDFTAEILSHSSPLDLLKAISKSLIINGNHIGEKIYADVVRTGKYYELYVTKPYLEKGMLTIHFN